MSSDCQFIKILSLLFQMSIKQSCFNTQLIFDIGPPSSEASICSINLSMYEEDQLPDGFMAEFVSVAEETERRYNTRSEGKKNLQRAAVKNPYRKKASHLSNSGHRGRGICVRRTPVVSPGHSYNTRSNVTSVAVAESLKREKCDGSVVEGSASKKRAVMVSYCSATYLLLSSMSNMFDVLAIQLF